MARPTLREQQMDSLADEDKKVAPQRYDITSKNLKAARVVHDYHGVPVFIPPGETKRAILLRPRTAEYLGKGDLALVAAQHG